MFERLGSLTYRFRFAIVAAWVAMAIGAVLFAPSLASKGMTNQTDFLPADVDSGHARQVLDREFPGELATTSATVSFSRDGALTESDRAWIAETESWVTTTDELHGTVGSVATAASRPELESMLRSADGELELMTVNLNVATAGSAADVVIAALRDHLVATAPDGLAVHVTGSAAISADYLAAIVKGTDSTTLVTVVLVIAILLLIYRAPLAALVPLVTIGIAFVVSRGILGVLAAAGWRISSLLDTFIVVLVFGVGTDYAIFLISRFREEVAKSSWHHASRTTVRRIGAVISASAATVIVGLGSMIFAQFGMIQTMGPALAIAIFVTLIAGLTLAPALLGIFGHYLFWPLHTRTETDGEPGGLFSRLAGAVSRRPVLVTVIVLVVLAVPATAMGQMRTNFDVLAELPADSDARLGFDEVATHLGKGKVVQSTAVIDGGAGSDLLTPASLARIRDLGQTLVATDGVATVTSLVSPDGDGVVPDELKPSGQLSRMAGEFEDQGTGRNASSEQLLESDVTDGLDTATQYLALLGQAYPDVAAGAKFHDLTTDLATARDQVARARDNAVVPTQLRSLARAMTSPTASAGGDSETSVGIMGDYLDELAAAFPAVRAQAAFDKATAAAASLEGKATIAAALDLSSALSSLATWFEDNLPDATLFPDSLSGTAEARALRAEVEATFKRLPVDLEALSAVFAPRADDVFVPVGVSGDSGKDLEEAVSAFFSDDHTATRFYLTTDDDPYSPAAFATVRRAQAAMTASAPGFGAGAGAYLGGPTAEFSDVQTVLGRDFERVAIFTVLGIFVVLVLLLRAIVAPLYLVATVLLSCATALGLSAWLFQSVLGQAGASFYLPIMVFVLLVALGSDYNIFLMSRVREESEHRPIRDGIRVASGRTGAVITSAGLILAGTFGSMAFAPLVVLFQVGVAVALGVLIDTFVVRSILVPAITTIVRDRAWWPWGTGAGAFHVGWPVVISVPETAGALVGGASRRRVAIAVALIALVPMMFAGLLTWSLSNPVANLNRVTAAVVNEDTGAVSTSANGTTTQLTLGADLARGLVSGAATDTFTWVEVADAQDAQDGLVDGRYAAVLKIPSDFSQTVAVIRALASGGGSDAAADAARLQLATNDATSYLLGPIARSISDTIALSAAEEVTATYVDDVLLSVITAKDNVAASAAGADRVATRSTDLASGAATVSDVAGELVTGLEQMAASTSVASSGFDKLAAGIDQLAIGTRKIATGASKLSDGTQASASGSKQLADGTAALADGLDTMAQQTAGLPAQAAQLATAAAGVSTGINATADGLHALRTQILEPLATLATAANGTATDAAARTAGVADHAAKRAAEAGALATGAGSLATDVAGYVGRVASLASECTALGGTDELCSRLTSIAGDGTAVASGAAATAGDAGALATRTATLAGDAAEAAGYAGALPAITAQLEGGSAQATTVAGQLEAGITQPQAAGVPSLQATADLVAAGTAELAQQTPLLAAGTSDAASGASAVNDGASKLADGLSQLATGAASLASGAALTADGAAKVAGGTSDAASGASKLAGVVNDAVDAGRMVQAEANGLTNDGQSVADDAKSLASTLQDDAASIPTWSAKDRETLGAVIANPVAVDSTRLNALPATGAGLAPYFMALALWLGALAVYLLVPALPRRSDDERRWIGPLGAYAAGAAIAMAQAVLMVVVLRYGVGVDIARLPELIGFAILVALCAVAVVQALVAVFGTRGWFVALFLIVIQLASAGAWFPVETAPAVFGAIHPLLPMSYAVDAFRTLVAGGGSPLAPAVAVIGLWTAAALAVTLVATRVRTDRSTRQAALGAT